MAIQDELGMIRRAAEEIYGSTADPEVRRLASCIFRLVDVCRRLSDGLDDLDDQLTDHERQLRSLSSLVSRLGDRVGLY